MKNPFSADSYQPAMTLDEIAESIGLSVSRVRQIEKRALHKLRRLCRERGIELGDIIVEADTEPTIYLPGPR